MRTRTMISETRAGLEAGLTLMTIHEALREASDRLAEAGIEAAGLEAESLMAHVLGTNRAGVITRGREMMGAPVLEAFSHLIERRASREPAQYITGREEFRGMTFRVTPDVLIPRPETELLVEVGAALLKDVNAPVIADIGTGSGCIAVSFAAALPGATVCAVDSSPAALNVARENADSNGVAGRVKFIEGDLLVPLEAEGLKGALDLMASNPPYIPSGEIPGLQPEVLFEPHGALDGGPDGLDAVRRLISGAPVYLKPGGWLLIEIGFGQAEAARALTDASGGLEFVEVKKDFAGVGRVLVARKKH